MVRSSRLRESNQAVVTSEASQDPPRSRSSRVRQPRPLLARRLPSGRGATEQPNAAGDEDAELSARFWALTVATGVATGLLGIVMYEVLNAVQHLAFGYHHGTFAAGVAHAAGSRRVIALAAGGLVTGVGWYLLRRAMPSRSSDLDDALWSGRRQLSFRRSFPSAVLSEIAVGAGASLGREAAPKLVGAASGSALATWAKLTPGQRRLLVACGGGAGMAAIYNVPLGGALLAAEVLYGSLSLPVVLPALACSVVATITSWIVLPNRPTYGSIPGYHLHPSLVIWAVPAGVLIGLISVGHVRLIGWVSAHRPTGWRVAIGPLLAFTAVGLIGLHYPQLLGNGADMAGPAFVGVGSMSLFLALSALKPLATAACLGSGATGGLFTPTLSIGAVLGGFLGLAWIHLWGGAPVGAYALVGAAAMLGAGLQAPFAGLVLILELTNTTISLLVPMVVATVLATAIARLLDGYSIYSARLPAL